MMFPYRIVPALMLFLCSFVSYFMRVSINVTILEMTKNITMCGSQEDRNDGDRGSTLFCWSELEKSLVLGTFYYGYALLQVPGGRLAEVYGTKVVLGSATFISGLMMLISPWASYVSVWLLIILRGLIGLAQGVLFPSFNPMLVRWALKNEHAKFCAFSNMGGTFGTIIIYPFCGLILEKYHWETVFYLSGIATLVWCFFWYILISDDPADNKFVGKEEVEYILSNRVYDASTKTTKVPYCEIVKSRRVQVIMLCSFANDMGLYIILTMGPNFIKTVLRKDIKTVALLSSLPYCGRFLFSQVAGFLTDLLIGKKVISTINVRRIMFSIAFISPAIGLIILGYLTNNWEYCIAVMTICLGLNGFIIGGLLNVIDVAPVYPGTTMGFANGFSSISGFIVPLMTASIIQVDPSDPDLWKGVFFIGAACYLTALVIFFWLGRAEPGKFNKIVPNTREEDVHLMVNLPKAYQE